MGCDIQDIIILCYLFWPGQCCQFQSVFLRQCKWWMFSFQSWGSACLGFTTASCGHSATCIMFIGRASQMWDWVQNSSRASQEFLFPSPYIAPSCSLFHSVFSLMSPLGSISLAGREASYGVKLEAFFSYVFLMSSFQVSSTVASRMYKSSVNACWLNQSHGIGPGIGVLNRHWCLCKYTFHVCAPFTSTCFLEAVVLQLHLPTKTEMVTFKFRNANFVCVCNQIDKPKLFTLGYAPIQNRATDTSGEKAGVWSQFCH